MSSDEHTPLPGEATSSQTSPSVAPGEGEGAAQAAPKLSLREQLESAWDADEKGGEQAGDPRREPPSLAKDTPPRNELGQFVKQGDSKGELKTPGEPRADAPKVPGTGSSPPEAIAPASWSPAAKAAFAGLPDLIRQEVLKRESDWNAGQAQRSQDAERLNRLNSVLGPRQDWFRLQGVDEVQALQQLLAASDLLDRDPIQGLLFLARRTGVDPRYLAQVAMGQPVQQQGDPNFLALQQQVQTLQQSLSQRDQAAEQAEMDRMLAEIDRFAADPAHVYFENVRGQMSALIRAQAVETLDQAYEQAIWAHPEIRPLLQQQQQAAAEEEARKAAQARAQSARFAAGSVTGSPTPGAPSGLNGGSRRSLREELEANWNQFSE